MPRDENHPGRFNGYQGQVKSNALTLMWWPLLKWNIETFHRGWMDTACNQTRHEIIDGFHRWINQQTLKSN